MLAMAFKLFVKSGTRMRNAGEPRPVREQQRTRQSSLSSVHGARMDGEVRALRWRPTVGGAGGARSVGERGEASGGTTGSESNEQKPVSTESIQ
jgi:hypothetical protein